MMLFLPMMLPLKYFGKPISNMKNAVEKFSNIPMVNIMWLLPMNYLGCTYIYIYIYMDVMSFEKLRI